MMVNTFGQTLCSICNRELTALSPQMDRFIDGLKQMGRIPPTAVDKDTMPEPPVELSDGSLAHTTCNEVKEFLDSLGVDDATTALRLKGYAAGKTFGGYMNWPLGLDHPSVNSYRQLQCVSIALHAVEQLWGFGKLVPDDQFKTDGDSWYVADVVGIAFPLLAFADLAEAALSLALVSWRAAHLGESTRKMFLDWHNYKDEWKKESEYFKAKVNKEIAHNDKDNPNWNPANTNEAYSPYPNWMDEWQRFKAMAGHSLDLCKVEINIQQDMPEPLLLGLIDGAGGNRSIDFVQSAADCFTAFGPPVGVKKTQAGEEYPPTPLGQNGWYKAFWDGGKLIVP